MQNLAPILCFFSSLLIAYTFAARVITSTIVQEYIFTTTIATTYSTIVPTMLTSSEILIPTLVPVTLSTAIAVISTSALETPLPASSIVFATTIDEELTTTLTLPTPTTTITTTAPTPTVVVPIPTETTQPPEDSSSQELRSGVGREAFVAFSLALFVLEVF